MGASEIHHLVHQYGLALVFAAAAAQALGPPVPATTVLVAGAIYAATGHGPTIAAVIAAGAAGALAGTSIAFWIGRHASEDRLVAIATRLRVDPRRVTWLRGELAAHGGKWVFVTRFITGLRNVSGLLAGACGMPFARFAWFAAVAALAWAASAGLEYYWFGRAVIGAPTWLQIVLVCLGLAVTGATLWFMRRRALARLGALDDAPEAGPPPVTD